MNCSLPPLALTNKRGLPEMITHRAMEANHHHDKRNSLRFAKNIFGGRAVWLKLLLLWRQVASHSPWGLILTFDRWWFMSWREKSKYFSLVVKKQTKNFSRRWKIEKMFCCQKKFISLWQKRLKHFVGQS